MYENRYFIVFIGVILLVLGIAATITFIEDPSGVFHSDKYENEMVDILLSGHNVTLKGNVDWGRFQSTYIARDLIDRDTIVLGSSRVMVISNAMLDPLNLPKDRKFLNNWVADAKLGDEIAIVMCYAEKGEIPGTIIFGLDPHSFYREGVRFPSLNMQYTQGLKRIEYSPRVQDELSLLENKYFVENKYFGLISYPNVITAIDKTRTGRVGINLTPTDEIYGEDWIDSWDGTRTFPKLAREITAEKVESDARRFAETDSWKMNPDQLKIFDSFTQDLLEHHVRVIIFLPPWHSLIYQKFSTVPSYRMVLESEDYIRRYAEAKNITVIGSYDPTRYNLTSADFYDPTHVKSDAISRIFAAGDIGRRV